MDKKIIHVLVVSENKVLLRNLFEWFRYRIDDHTLQIDHARNKEEAEAKMKENKYDKIFHNGIYIVDVIEKMQIGAEVWNFDHTNNKYGAVDPNDKNVIRRIMRNQRDKINLTHWYMVLFILISCSFMFWSWQMNETIGENKVNIIDLQTSTIHLQATTDSMIVSQAKVAKVLDALIIKVNEINKVKK